MVRPLVGPAETRTTGRVKKQGTPPSAVPTHAPSGSTAAPLAVAGCRPLEELIGLMARRDEGALAAFYDATVSRVYAIALRILRTASEAEEVAVDTIHQAWREASRYDATRGAPMAWVLTICRTRSLDKLRGRDRAIVHDDPHSLRGAQDDAETSGDPHDLVAALEANAAVSAVLARLAPVQRQMLGLAFFRGFTHEEIASHACLPLGTVKSQIRRALATLRRDLAGL